MPTKNKVGEDGELRVFAVAAELFSVLSAPIRLRILGALCDSEQSVSQILEKVDNHAAEFVAAFGDFVQARRDCQAQRRHTGYLQRKK